MNGKAYEMNKMPKLLKIEDFAILFNLSKPQAYDAVHNLPNGVKILLGKRIRINEERLMDWLNNGGNFAK